MRRPEGNALISWAFGIAVACTLACGPTPVPPPTDDYVTIEEAVLIADTAVATHVFVYHDTTVVDPPPPPPPPEGDHAVGGYVFTEGFWEGHRVDEEENYRDQGSYGEMKRNAAGLLYIGDGLFDGSARFRVRLTDPSQYGAGGRHLCGVSGTALAKRPRDSEGNRYPPGDTRVDLDRPSAGSIRVHLYNKTATAPLRERTQTISVPDLVVGTTATLDVEWHQANDRLTLDINGNRIVWDLIPDSMPLGRYLYTGNMDNINGWIRFYEIGMR